MELRPYQKECIEIIEKLEPGAYLIQMATGLGKTYTMANISRRGRMLILSHRDELVHQPIKYFNCPCGVEQGNETSHGEEVVSASVMTLHRRLQRFKPDDFDIIVTDECFPAGTIVDGKPIENIKVGDYVTGYDHNGQTICKKKVTHVFRRPLPQQLVRINHSLVCTLNHPIYDVSQERYVDAASLCPGKSILLTMSKNNTLVQPDQIPKGLISSFRTRILQRRMQTNLLQKNQFRNNGSDKSKICFTADVEQQPCLQSRGARKDQSHFKRTQASPAYSWWQRHGIDKTARNTIKKNRKISSSSRIRIQNRNAKNQSGTSTNALQDRYSIATILLGYRNRRKQPLCTFTTRTRPQKREIFELTRVDSIEIFESRSNKRSRAMSTDDYVYNLEVEDVNNYFANGVLVHNCHHAAAKTYRKIYDYFKPRLHLGFTATPARGDHIRLDDIYSSIIYKKDILWGIQNKWLCDINCLRVDIGYDIRRVKVHRGDYDIGQLSAILNQKKANEGIAEAYKKYAKGQTVIFAVSVEHAEAIAEYIEGAVIISASTPNRQEILDKFMKRDIPCLVNCMILTEGTDLPLIETIIIARPTRNTSLYQQMVGRGLRLYPGKTDLTLIDCVGTAEVNDLCTAPSLLGIDMSQVPEKKRDKITGKLTEMQAKVTMLVDMTPEAWILSYRQLNLFMQRNKYDDCGVRYNMSADGSMLCSLKQQMTISITPPDQLGMSRCIFKYIQNGQMITKHTDLVPLQTLFTKVRAFLDRNFDTQRYLWDKSLSNIWSSQPASDKQIEFINRLQEQHSDETDFSGFDPEKITKGEASIVIDRLKTMD